MTRPLFHSPAQRRTTLALLGTILALAIARTLLVHHLRRRDLRVRALSLPSAQARRLAHGLSLPGHPEAAALLAQARQFFATRLGLARPSHRAAASASASASASSSGSAAPRLAAGREPPVVPAHAAPTQLQRVRHVVARLSFYDGYGAGRAGVTHVAVSVVGIVGMFAAIIGALLGPWLADSGDDPLDEDGFSFWACDEEQADVRICGHAREERLWLMRLFELA